ncbi:hypothetical protein ONZ45_g15738 [Pleurotus djamor]|nr:hypothetical protein ONZ45_g15738 [Pleurotus djamor]
MSDFAHYHPFKRKDQIFVKTANSHSYIKGVGTVLFRYEQLVERNGEVVRQNKLMKLYPVYYMPEMGELRLISTGTFLQDRNRELRATRDRFEFIDGRLKDPVIMSGYHRGQHDTCYWTRGTASQESIVQTNAILLNSVDFDTWHQRLGHPSPDVLRQFKKHTENFPDLKIPADRSKPCKGCAEGKTPQDSFPQSLNRASKPFEKVHSDLKEFPVKSYHGYHYYISFFDDYTSYGWVRLLKRKSEALTATRDFIAMVKTQYNTMIKTWMSDGGGEFKSLEFKEMLNSNGIKIDQSVAHQPQQNGRAERFNRTIMDKAQAMRFHACIPPSWWEFSVEYAIHLYNRTPIRRLKWKTPFEMLKGKLPDITHLRVFGCGAYVYLPDAVRPNKLSPKAELMCFIGLTEGIKGYKFMRLHNNTVFHETKALFDETLLPKCPKSDCPDRRSNGRKPPSNDNPDNDSGPSGAGGGPRPPSPSNSEGSGSENDLDLPPRSPSPQGSAEDDPVENDQLPERSPSPELHPPPPPDPVNEPEPEPEDWVNRPRRSGRQRKVAKGPPGSIYEEDGEQRLPHEIQRDIEDSAKWRKLVGDNEPGSSRLPTTSRRRGKTQPQANQPAPDDPGPSTQILDKEIDDLTRMSQEGGVEFMKFLLSKAVAVSEPETEPVTVPNANAELNPDNIREWTYRDIMRLLPDQRKPWIEACKEELKSLRARNVYSLVKLPKGRKAIKCRWVFDIKSDGRKKARLVAKGFSQREGIDFNEIFSPVVRYETFRMILALAAVEGWHLEGLDVKTAFLYGKLDEEIYMEQPEGFHAQDKKDFVFRLWRALYGLKQAALSWWKELSKSMEQLGFKRAKSDSGLFIYTHPNGSVVIAIIYVDDALFCGSDRQLVLKLKAAFMKRWECRDLGEAKEFLRMRILRKGPKIYLDQETYLQKVIRRFNLDNCNTARTPLPTGYRPEPHKGSVDPALRSRFQQVIGSLLYIMLGTRPDIAYALVKLSQHSANPSKEHLDKALYVVRYLAGTQHYSVCYDGSNQEGGLIAFTDSDWTSPRSTTGYLVKLAGGIISWQSHAQRTPALSSTEAEYMALSDTCRQIMWTKNLLSEIGMDLGPVPICGDNQGSIFIASNPVSERRTKHIDLRYHYIRDHIESGDVECFFISGAENPADMFTKNLGWVKFTLFRSMLGIRFFDSAASASKFKGIS